MKFQSFQTVNTFRRNYGRRYTLLPVDTIDGNGFTIDCSESHMRPEHYDLLAGDLVRWLDGERFVEATIAEVRREERQVLVRLQDPRLLPPDYFPF